MCEVADWDHKRNQGVVKINWRFTTKDARIELKKPILLFRRGQGYPVIPSKQDD